MPFCLLMRVNSTTLKPRPHPCVIVPCVNTSLFPRRRRRPPLARFGENHNKPGRGERAAACDPSLRRYFHLPSPWREKQKKTNNKLSPIRKNKMRTDGGRERNAGRKRLMVQVGGGMKEGRPPHPQLRAAPLFGQDLMKVGNHGNRHIHKSQLKKKREKKGKKKKAGCTRTELCEEAMPRRSHQVICQENKSICTGQNEKSQTDE